MKAIRIVAFVVLPFLANAAFAHDRDGDAIVGAAFGGVLGGIIGSQMGGRDGAVVGAGLGALAGVAISSQDRHDDRGRYYDGRRYDNDHNYYRERGYRGERAYYGDRYEGWNHHGDLDDRNWGRRDGYGRYGYGHD